MLPEPAQVSSDTLRVCRGEAYELGFPVSASFRSLWLQATAVVWDIPGVIGRTHTGVRRVRHLFRCKIWGVPKSRSTII